MTLPGIRVRTPEGINYMHPGDDPCIVVPNDDVDDMFILNEDDTIHHIDSVLQHVFSNPNAALQAISDIRAHASPAYTQIVFDNVLEFAVEHLVTVVLSDDSVRVMGIRLTEFIIGIKLLVDTISSTTEHNDTESDADR